MLSEMDFIIEQRPTLINPNGTKITEKQMRKEITRCEQELENDPTNEGIVHYLNKIRYICKLYFGTFEQEDL